MESSRVEVRPPRLSKLEESYRQLASAGGRLADRFFERLFAQYPDLKTLPQVQWATGPQELLAALELIFANRRDPARVRDQMTQLGRQHAERGLRPQHYRLICEQLVRAMAEVAGPDWDAELECEWTCSLSLGTAAMIEGAPLSA